MAAFVEVVPRLQRLTLLPLDLLNVYLLDDVLLDAGGPRTTRRLLAALEGHRVSALALTHAHFDHQGGADTVCQALDVPLWCGAGDRRAVESGDGRLLYRDPERAFARLAGWMAGPAHPVARTLREGDVVGGFTVVETPGHTPGHLAFWREDDRVLVLGDVLFHRNPLTLRHGLAEPYRCLVYDHARNRESLRRLVDLDPEVVCFGHGEPLHDPHRIRAFARAPARRAGAALRRLAELPATPRAAINGE